MRSLVIALALAGTAGACGDNQRPPATEDAAPIADAVTPDAGPTVRGPCLDRPTDLPRPPTGELPCELYPPGSGASP